MRNIVVPDRVDADEDGASVWLPGQMASFSAVGESNSRTRNVSIGGVPLPATVTATADFDLKATIWSLAASYRVVAGDEAAFDLMAGARLGHLKQDLEWTFSADFGPITPPPRTSSRDASVDQWDAIVGGKGRITFGPDRSDLDSDGPIVDLNFSGPSVGAIFRW